MRQQQAALTRVGVEVAIVTFDTIARAKAYVAETDTSWPILFDTDRLVYHQFGMIRGTWGAIYRPRSIFKYLQLLAKGERLAKPGSDLRQMGGDVLLDPGGIIRLIHASQDPHDRPSVAELLAVVAANGSPQRADS